MIETHFIQVESATQVFFDYDVHEVTFESDRKRFTVGFTFEDYEKFENTYNFVIQTYRFFSYKVYSCGSNKNEGLVYFKSEWELRS